MPSRYDLRSLALLGFADCMRRCAAPLMSDLSGDEEGEMLATYALARLSRVRSCSLLAAAWMLVETFGRVCRLGEPGLSGNGGGARSGSELSHLILERCLVSPMSTVDLCGRSANATWPRRCMSLHWDRRSSRVGKGMLMSVFSIGRTFRFKGRHRERLPCRQYDFVQKTRRTCDRGGMRANQSFIRRSTMAL